jgi:hypothetical protein
MINKMTKVRLPWWAVMLAGVVFVCMQILMNTAMRKDPHAPPVAVIALISFFVGAVLAALLLLAGYVNVDAKRRGMNSVLWTLVVIFVPNGIGFLLYFLMRKPLVGECPRCHAEVQSGFAYCPNCRQELLPACPACGRSSEMTGPYCPFCGAQRRTPAPGAAPAS